MSEKNLSGKNHTGLQSSQAKKGLGRGIGALLENTNLQLEDESEIVLKIDINDISPMSNQPRQHFDEEKLRELAESIRVNGLIQPILVTQRGTRDYQLIAGERRWRASRMAGLKEIPAIVRNVQKEDIFKQALIENIQREDLNAVEEAKAFARLLEEHHMTQEELASVLSKSRSAIANTVRLLKLPEEILDLIASEEIREGHARCLLALPSGDMQIQMADQMVERELSVREAEKLVKNFLEGSGGKKPLPKDSQEALSIKKVEERLTRAIGAKVRLYDREGKGRLVIRYGNLRELDELIEKFEK